MAKVVASSNSFVPLALEKTTVDGVIDQTSPLFDASFRFMRVMERMGTQRIALVKTGVANQAHVYVIDRFFRADDIPVLQALNIKDATGNTTAENIFGLGVANETMVFAAVLGNGEANFGDTDSGIAVLNVMDEATEENKSRRVLKQIDVGSGVPINVDDTRAASLEYDNSAIAINNSAVSIANAVDLWWDAELRVLYGALQITGNSAANDGARGVFVGSFDTAGTTELTLREIAPDSVFTVGNNNEIIGGVDADVQVSIFKVRTMHTSTGLPYLIVVGGNNVQQNKVFALPLVNKRNNQGVISVDDLTVHGTIAKKDADPIDVISNQDTPRFLGRKFDVPATTAMDIPISSDIAALVGGDGIASGDIVDIRIVGDAVFVCVSEPETNQKSGIFYSQALLDEKGRIKGWTQWQRVGGTTNKVFGFALDAKLGNFTFIHGTDVDSINSVKRTSWENNDESLRGQLPDLLRGIMPQTAGGIRGLFDFSQNTPGLNDIALTVATGNGVVALIETGHIDDNDVLCPNEGEFTKDSVAFENGAITQDFPDGLSTQFVSISGGVLSELGPITAAEIVQLDELQHGWLVVGGVGGVAMLVNPDGSGWTTPDELSYNFEGLVNGMSFKKIGNYRFVRKLICDNDFLYVLTDTVFDRIDLSSSDFAIGQLTKVTLATLSDLPRLGDNGTLIDILVSEKFALLTTSAGVFRIGNGKNIATVTSVADMGWTRVTIPNEQIPVTKIISTSLTGRIQDVARMGGGTICLLSNYRGKERAQINRFLVSDTSVAAISDTTLQTIPDIFKLVPFGNGGPSYFVNFGNVRDVIAKDGAVLFNGRDREDPEALFFDNNTRTNRTVIPLDISTGNDVLHALRSCGTGSWFIAGDFGLRINE